MAELINESEFEITGALKKENHLKKSLLVLSRKEVTIVRYLELPKSDRHPGPDACKLLWNCKQQNGVVVVVGLHNQHGRSCAECSTQQMVC